MIGFFLILACFANKRNNYKSLCFLSFFNQGILFSYFNDGYSIKVLIEKFRMSPVIYSFFTKVKISKFFFQNDIYLTNVCKLRVK